MKGTKNMNILRFINSPDIRAHLEKINYQFTPLEAAWLVYQCKNATLNEKHEAWQEIIDTMPDCEIKDPDCEIYDSLHDYLKEYMELENRSIDKFYEDEENAVYYYGITVNEYDPYCTIFTVFSTFDDCTSFINEDLKEIDGDFDSAIITVTKKFLNDRNIGRRIRLTSDNEIISVGPIIVDYYNWLGKMILSFPVPFEKGDILFNPNDEFESLRKPFVFNEIFTDYDCDTGTRARITMDITIEGYSLNHKDRLCRMHSYNLMNLQYCTQEKLTGEWKKLIHLSNYLKGEMDIISLIKRVTK